MWISGKLFGRRSRGSWMGGRVEGRENYGWESSKIGGGIQTGAVELERG